MRKQFLFIFLALIVANTNQGQTRSTRIGYIDMEYILENVSDYKEAKAQLELKATKWKQEIETKKIEISKLKESLKAEKALLTKELIEEKETEIRFLEDEMLLYQQKQFGADGNLMLQKALWQNQYKIRFLLLFRILQKLKTMTLFLINHLILLCFFQQKDLISVIRLYVF